MERTREIMASGQLYDANYDPELIEQRSKCKSLCQEFNTLPYDAADRKMELLRRIVGSTPQNFVIEPSFPRSQFL